MKPRVVSLAPGATEIIASLVGESGGLVGVSSECDMPGWVKELPVVVRPAAQTEVPRPRTGRTPRTTAFPRLVVDTTLLGTLQPDVIVAPRHQDVRSAAGDALTSVVESLDPVPHVLEVAPETLDDVLEDVERLGAALGCFAAASAWRERILFRLAEIRLLDELDPPPRVLFLDRADPFRVAGLWIPQLIEVAGGLGYLTETGDPPHILDWNVVRGDPPDVIVLGLAGCDVRQSAEHLAGLRALEGWAELPAVQQRQVYAVDARTFFGRLGPRVLDGIELLAALLRELPLDPRQAARLTT